MSVILETKQLCKFYGAGENQVKAVNQVDIQIEQGEFVAIVGKSGSGKSTLLHMLGGLDTPTKGSVTLAGKDLYRMKEDALAVFRRRKSEKENQQKKERKRRFTLILGKTEAKLLHCLRKNFKIYFFRCNNFHREKTSNRVRTQKQPLKRFPQAPKRSFTALFTSRT